MAWILFLLAAACFAAPFLTSSFALGALCLLLALLLALLGVVQLLSARMADNRRDLISPAELQALRANLQRPPADPSGTPATKDD